MNAVLKYVIFIGAAGLTIVAVIPFVFNGLFSAEVSFGGTSLIIIVSVILETMKTAGVYDAGAQLQRILERLTAIVL